MPFFDYLKLAKYLSLSFTRPFTLAPTSHVLPNVPQNNHQTAKWFCKQHLSTSPLHTDCLKEWNYLLSACFCLRGSFSFLDEVKVTHIFNKRRYLGHELSLVDKGSISYFSLTYKANIDSQQTPVHIWSLSSVRSICVTPPLIQFHDVLVKSTRMKTGTAQWFGRIVLHFGLSWCIRYTYANITGETFTYLATVN